MIRTAILAAILLVMLSIAYSRPGTLPRFGTRAPAVAEDQDVVRALIGGVARTSSLNV